MREGFLGRLAFTPEKRHERQGAQNQQGSEAYTGPQIKATWPVIELNEVLASRHRNTTERIVCAVKLGWLFIDGGLPAGIVNITRD
jgi:hypothetical protein